MAITDLFEDSPSNSLRHDGVYWAYYFLGTVPLYTTLLVVSSRDLGKQSTLRKPKKISTPSSVPAYGRHFVYIHYMALYPTMNSLSPMHYHHSARIKAMPARHDDSPQLGLRSVKAAY